MKSLLDLLKSLSEKAKDATEKYPLHTAASKGKIAKVHALLAKDKKDLNRLGGISHYSPLMYAYINNHYDCMLALLEAGANPYQVHENGDTVLHSAIMARANPFIRLCIWFKPDFEGVLPPPSQRHPLTMNALQCIEFWAKDPADKNGAKRLTFILQSAQISRDFHSTYKQANELLAKPPFSKAADSFFRAGELIAKQSQMEMDPEFYSEAYQIAHKTFAHYYKTKALEYYQKACELYGSIASLDEQQVHYFKSALEKYLMLAQELFVSINERWLQNYHMMQIISSSKASDNYSSLLQHNRTITRRKPVATEATAALLSHKFHHN